MNNLKIKILNCKLVEHLIHWNPSSTLPRTWLFCKFVLHDSSIWCFDEILSAPFPAWLSEDGTKQHSTTNMNLFSLTLFVCSAVSDIISGKMNFSVVSTLFLYGRVDQYKVNCIAIQYKGVCIELNCCDFERKRIVLYCIVQN